MKKQLSENWLVSQSLLRFLIIILLVIGVFFRFVNLDKKLYWSDEVVSSLRISGYMQSEVEANLRNGHLISIEELDKYQYPNGEKNTIDVMKGIVLEDSQILPLHVLMTRFWVKCFGNSIAVTRSFSAFISLLTFPSIYWLSKELFRSSLTGWIAMALVAVSPPHVIYAQEARAYSLWIVAILISSAALLRAMRLKTKVSWCIYTATLSLGFYSHIFFGFVALAQAIYVAVIEGFRLNKTSIYYLVASLVGFMTFVPWIWIIITNPHADAVYWANVKQTLFDSATRWAGIISRGFLDLGISPSDSKQLKFALIPFVGIILTLIIYSIYVLCRKSPKKVWLFILTLIGSVGFPLLILDFMFQKRYGTSRYTLPCILGIQLTVAYLFATKIRFNSTKIFQKNLWSVATFLVIISGIISCGISSQSQIWWNKFPEKYEEYPKIANIVSQYDKALLITDGKIVPEIQILGHLVVPKVRFQIVASNKLPEIPSGFSDIFLFQPSDFLKAGIEKTYNSKLQQIDKFLWKMVKSS
ncbi:MAG: glycosyltransferase family 39 protein [Nostoc sp. DedQUE01]|nr:glycosyltransferase family 39 protein [Nostoc sp. DedQUE01]